MVSAQHYSDRCSRIGLRLGDLLRPDLLRQALRGITEQKNAWFSAAGLAPIDPDKMFAELSAAGDQLRAGIVDTGAVLRAAQSAGQRILIEGAQGCLLDLEQGTYPYVTSSHASTGGAFSGTGLPPHALRVVGIAKAYATRVGEGPFPTELKDELGNQLRIAGNEFGSTTGRPRRCGWFDSVAVRYSGAISGAGELVLTNLDVLRGFSPLRICVAYRLPDGRRVSALPAFELETAVPEFIDLPGFAEDVRAVRKFELLPANAQAYVKALEHHTGLPIRTVSVGPERQQVILR